MRVRLLVQRVCIVKEEVALRGELHLEHPLLRGRGRGRGRVALRRQLHLEHPLRRAVFEHVGPQVGLPPYVCRRPACVCAGCRPTYPSVLTGAELSPSIRILTRTASSVPTSCGTSDTCAVHTPRRAQRSALPRRAMALARLRIGRRRRGRGWWLWRGVGGVRRSVVAEYLLCAVWQSLGPGAPP